MKLVVLIPSAGYLENAGARIRYSRIREECAALGGGLKFIQIDEFDAGQTVCDAVLISKCHDARAVICAIRASEHGIRVGVDLFDDYFSQANDSRLSRYRNWLAQLVPHLSFALCSTNVLADVARSYRPGLRVHVMNDPALTIDSAKLAEVLHVKQVDFRDRETLEICWFGMGRNPHFRVGIHDLATFGGVLGDVVKHGITPQLTVLTNVHALRAEDLVGLQRLPLPVKVEQWSEAREAEVLKSAHVAFIPVNAQSFSIAKSLNRAWTALAAGCQVISAGYPLYAALDPLIYRSVGTLIDDLRHDQAKLRLETLAQLARLHETFGSAAREARNLADFLANLRDDGRQGHGRLLCLVHGAATSGAVHKFVNRYGGLTICSPFSAADLDCDITFWAHHPGGPLHVLLGPRARSIAEDRGQVGLVPAGRIGGQSVWSLPGSPPAEASSSNWSGVPVAAQLAAYPSVTREIQRTLVSLFGSIELVLAENSVWPFAPSFRR